MDETNALQNRRHLRTLRDLVTEARMIEIGKADLNSDALVTGVYPRLNQLLARAVDSLAAVESGSEEPIGDLCFLAAESLKSTRRHLERLSGNSDTFALFSTAEEIVEKIVEGLSAVEGELARSAGLESMTDRMDLRHDSLRLRRLVAKFRRRVTGALAGTYNQKTTLRTCGAALAWLRGQDDFSSVRASDRLLARDLQERILRWLRAPDCSEEDGRRLRDEITTFVTIIEQINSRAVLLHHDLVVVREVISQLSTPASPAVQPAPWRLRLSSIQGRDDELDRLLEAQADGQRLLDRLLLLRLDLEQATGTPVAGSSALPLETRVFDHDEFSRRSAGT